MEIYIYLPPTDAIIRIIRCDRLSEDGLVTSFSFLTFSMFFIIILRDFSHILFTDMRMIIICWLLLFVDEEANNNWPEVLQFMFDCVQSDDARLKDAALQIFRYACHSTPTGGR